MELKKVLIGDEISGDEEYVKMVERVKSGTFLSASVDLYEETYIITFLNESGERTSVVGHDLCIFCKEENTDTLLLTDEVVGVNVPKNDPYFKD